MIASNFASRTTLAEWCLVVAELNPIVLEPTTKPRKYQPELSEKHDPDRSPVEGKRRVSAMKGLLQNVCSWQ